MGRALVVGGILLGASTGLRAQTAPSPGTILKQSTPPPPLPTAPDSVLKLPGPSQQSADDSTPIPVTHIELTGNSLISSNQLKPLVQGLEGRTVTLGALQLAAQRITALYQERGYPLAHAFVPAQTITKGVVRIEVVEPHYDRIDIDDHSRLRMSQAKSTLGLSAGSAIAQGGLERGLLLLNRTPGIRVAGTLVPGAQPATSTLQVRIDNTPLLHAAFYSDNYGNDSTGRARIGGSLSLDNPLGHGAQLTLNALTSTNGLLHSYGFSVTSPDLSNGLRAGAYGSHTDYRLGGDFAALEMSGRVRQVGADLDYPLLMAPGRLIGLRLDALHNDFAQRSGVLATDSRWHINLLRLSLNGAFADSGGGLTSGGLSISRGVLGLDSADARNANNTGIGAPGEFWVGQLLLQRDQTLPLGWNLTVRFSGQLASRSLDGSEQFYLGGPYAVMSAPANNGGGDDGVLLDARIMHPIPGIHTGRLQGGGMIQSGKVWRRSNAGTAGDDQHLTGAGLIVDYQWQRTVNASLAWSHPIWESRSGNGGNPRNELWARLTVNF
ncbi:POTRA domain-containing protein [Novosphingobium sp. ZN18A2]|uniref:ShlB/FhaC/HecB family hemolysin secretion/activation protein n=1 Tax=Novosphingobium sp. ZN18A2 TaxID=3079861 RepID=UPI0030CBD036